MEPSIPSFQKKLGYTFRDKNFLEMALKHPSYEFRKKPSPFERLEFLGDRVLGCVIADALYKLFPDDEEGLLSKRFVSLVRKEYLAGVARVWHLTSVLKITSMESPLPISVLADGVEAILGAIWLDGGFAAVQGVILSHWDKALNHFESRTLMDAKSCLQEWTQQQGIPLPEYKLLSTQGPDHNPLFTMSVSVNDTPCAKMAVGEGSSHRQAEQKAAEALLLLLHNPEAS